MLGVDRRCTRWCVWLLVLVILMLPRPVAAGRSVGSRHEFITAISVHSRHLQAAHHHIITCPAPDQTIHPSKDRPAIRYLATRHRGSTQNRTQMISFPTTAPVSRKDWNAREMLMTNKTARQGKSVRRYLKKFKSCGNYKSICHAEYETCAL